jgi:hypothetical protein
MTQKVLGLKTVYGRRVLVLNENPTVNATGLENLPLGTWAFFSRTIFTKESLAGVVPQEWSAFQKIDEALEPDKSLIRAYCLRPRTETFILDSQNIIDKGLMLSLTPFDEDEVQLFPEGGPMQRNGIDFICSGQTISWSGLGLDGVLEETDFVTIRYSFFPE